jgi:hypothetical protein
MWSVSYDNSTVPSSKRPRPARFWPQYIFFIKGAEELTEKLHYLSLKDFIDLQKWTGSGAVSDTTCTGRRNRRDRVRVESAKTGENENSTTLGKSGQQYPNTRNSRWSILYFL